MAVLDVYRGGALFGSFDIDERTVFRHKQNSEHKITATIISPTAIDFKVGDYIVHDGLNFEINQPVSATRSTQATIEYEVTFESYVYRLYNLSFLHQGEADFTYLGTLHDYASLIISNMNREDSGWTLGLIDTTEPLYMSFFGGDEGYSCRTALTAICERFGMEFWISGSGKTLNISKTAGRDTNYDFEVGRQLGLYSLTRRSPDNLQIVNRIRPKGSTRNIDFTYRNGAKRLQIDGDYVELPLEPNELRREATYIFEDIYPHRTGTIDSVAPDSLSFVDPTLFDINGQLIDGEQAMVVMQSGLLMGEEFEIASYDHATHTIRINELVLPNGEKIPNSITDIKAGDTYTITGILMPQMYIDQAEEHLRVRALELLSEPKRPVYDLEVDEKYVRDNIIVLKTGDRINVRDEEMGINDNIRVTSIEYPLVRPDALTVEISDVIPYTIAERIIIENGKTEQIVREVNVSSAEQARRNMLNLRTLQENIFDPDGYFDTDKIKPLSIETMMLSVGAKSQNFGLNNVVIDANTGGNPNLLSVSAGQLIHYEISIEGLGFTWEIPAKSFTLDPLKKYWLFARCSKTTLNGTWEISETPIKSEDPTYPNAYQFLLGLVYEVNNGRRDFDLTNGMTLMVGDTITTGRIKSLDGLNYFDLTQNTFKLGNASYGIDWNVTYPGRLAIKGGIIQSRSGAIDYPSVDRGNWSASGQYYLGDVVKSGGAWYKYINTSVQGGSGGLPEDNPLYWRLTADKGDTGPQGPQGPPGANGANGERGASLVGRGTWSALAQYRGDGVEVSAVKHGSLWYNAKKDVGLIPIGTAPTNTTYWEPFGAQFESIATGLLLAELAYITNLGVRYLQTDVPGNKRVDINGVDNNIRIMASNNKRYIELDDDTAKSITSGMFYIQFSTGNIPSPNIIAVDPAKDWSQYNSGSIDSRTGLQGNWANGFPLGYSGLFDSVTGGRRYYFYNTSAGVMLQNPFEVGDPINPITSISHDSAIIKNLMLTGMYGNGSVRLVNSYDYLDSGYVPDSVIMYEDTSSGVFTMPDIMSGSNFNYIAGKSNVYGRVVEFVNNSPGILTIQAASQLGMFRYKKTSMDTFTVDISQSVRMKLISLQSQPVFPQNWRWQIISISSL